MKTKNRADQSGFALVIVLFLMAAISTFLAMLVFSSSQRAFTATRLTDKIKAQAMAEAGCELGYAILWNDWDARYDPSAFSSSDGEESLLSSVKASGSTIQSTSRQPATYELDVEPIGTQAAIVTSTGTCGSVSAVSAISVQNLADNAPPDPILDSVAFSYAILCGGQFDFSGCGSIVAPEGALFHSNGKMFLRGNVDSLIGLSSSTSIRIVGNVSQVGDMTAPSLTYKPKSVNVDGTATETSVAPLEIPVVDLTPYYNWALKHGEVRSGFTATTDINPDGGILWVEGDIHISAHAVVNGSIIATGDINMSGQIDINPTTCAFGLVSRDGDIQVTSGGTINGLIYAPNGGLQHTANGEIVGQVIVNGDIKKAGNSDIMSGYVQSLPSPPDVQPITDYIAISAWQK
jgi:hypothetical protein